MHMFKHCDQSKTVYYITYTYKHTLFDTLYTKYIAGRACDGPWASVQFAYS